MSNELHFFDISGPSLNLFSFMMGVSFVSLMSIFSGRTFAVRMAFFYLAGLTFYYGYIKEHFPSDTTPSVNTPMAANSINSIPATKTPDVYSLSTPQGVPKKR